MEVLLSVTVPVPLAGFGPELIQAQAERCGLSLAAFMERAAERYAAEPHTDRPSRVAPRFLQESGQRVVQSRVDVELSPELWSALERDAEAHGVPIELIVRHAAMLLAAELGA